MMDIHPHDGSTHMMDVHSSKLNLWMSHSFPHSFGTALVDVPQLSTAFLPSFVDVPQL